MFLKTITLLLKEQKTKSLPITDRKTVYLVFCKTQSLARWIWGLNLPQIAKKYKQKQKNNEKIQTSSNFLKFKTNTADTITLAHFV